MLLAAGVGNAFGQGITKVSPDANFPDSVMIKVHASYDQVRGIHRWLFGENYRKEWAATVKLPVIRISRLFGGLTPEKFGGGMETRSIRMIDKTGKEWVIRSVEKIPDMLVPENLRQTFAVDWVDDEYSGQHPYSALIVPPLAVAARVPHANPVIGVLAADPVMGTFSADFAGRLVLMEEREPAGASDNTFKMLKAVYSNFDNRIDKKEVLRARMLDLLIGDWDRHEDQWRWAATRDGKEKIYVAVPRDRDQVFHLTEGLFPSIAQLPWLDPQLDHFDGKIPHVKYSLFKTRFIQPYPDAQFSYEEWVQVVHDFVKAETNEVLAEGIRRLPDGVYELRHRELLEKLKKRRDNLPVAMDEYYRFINKIVDLRLTDKDECVLISDTAGKGLHILVNKCGPGGKAGVALLDMTYHPEITKEIRLYLMGGNDQVRINIDSSKIKLRIVDSTGNKSFDIQHANNKIVLYGSQNTLGLKGYTKMVNTHFSKDTLNSRFLATNHYNLWMPLATAAINRDDGFLLGLGFRYTGKDGFRKLPYATVQELMITRSFATNAFGMAYNGQWVQAIGKADLVINATADAPDNSMNFFGQGNATALNKTGDYQRYYRARFNLYQVEPALRWATGKGASISAGPSLQFYHLNPDVNIGRSILQPGVVRSYDSTTLNKDRLHLGLVLNYKTDQRNNKVLPSKGYFLDMKVQGYIGLNNDSRSFLQVKPEFTYYQKLDSAGIFVLSDRLGVGIAFGNPAFYQSGFLGGQGNLLGYLQNRFAGPRLAFNNLQARVRLANLGGYILPGQLGITGFYDVGRVWVNGQNDDRWHHGVGGGAYFAPASLTVIQVLAGHSVEGWYPYISLNFRI